MPYEVTTSATGTYQIRHGGSGEVVVLDGVSLADLNVESAGEYFYALNLVHQANGAKGRGKVRHAIERALRSASANPVTHLLDVMVSVRWMVSDLAIPDEVLRIVVRRIAAETDILLND